MSLEKKMLIIRKYQSKVFLFWSLLIEMRSDFEVENKNCNTMFILIEGHKRNFK